jgi:hypothetical protein
MSDWHLDNWIPKISPNGRYATWVDYQSSSRGGDIYLFDSSNGQVIQVTDDGKKYRRPQVDDYGNMIWQDNRGYAGHIYIRKGDSGEVVRISEEGNKMGWDPQLNNGFAAWQSQGDIMYYDFALDRRTNLESIGGFGVHDWDPQIDASGNVGWKGGPLWDGTDIYYYDSDKNEVISLLDDDTQDTVLMINDENGFMLWQKHFSDGRKNLYLYDKNKVILLAENISMSSGRRGAYVAGNGDVLWVSGGIVYRYDYLDGTTVVLSDDFSDPAGTFAMNNRGDIAWRGSDNLYAARQYEARLYPGNGNFKRLRHDSGEIIEFYDTQRNRIALVYSPGEKVYRTYTWNDEDDTVKVKKYAGEYLFSNDILSGVEEQKMISETVYFTSGIDDPFKEKGEWEYVSKVEYLYSYDLSGKIIKREYACPGSEGYTKEYMLNGVYTVNPVLIRKKKTVDSEKETVYRVVHNEDARDVTVTFYFYEDNRDEDEAWNKFRLGVPGESVYIKDEYCGSHLEKRFIYVTLLFLCLIPGRVW